MTRSQFALAVLADEKWVENSARLLGLRLRYTTAEALSLGLVRVLNQEVGLTLAKAADLAKEALEHAPATERAIVGRKEHGSAGVAVDLARYHSAHGAALSAAMELGGARRRGRPRRGGTTRAVGDAIARAAEYGVDIDLLREGLRLSPRERLALANENAAFVNELRPSKGGDA